MHNDDSTAAESNLELLRIGENVRQLRKSKGMSCRALSEVSKVSERHLAQLEMGREISQLSCCPVYQGPGDTAFSLVWAGAEFGEYGNRVDQ